MSGDRCLVRALGGLMGDSGAPLGRLLGGSWRLLGGSWRPLGASKSHLGPKTVRAKIFERFLKKIGNFGDPSWRGFNIKNRIFGCSKRVSKIKVIFKAFRHRFWDDFRGSGNIKKEVFVWKGCIFLGFRAL